MDPNEGFDPWEVSRLILDEIVDYVNEDIQKML